MYVDTNIKGTLNVLQGARGLKTQEVLVTSTSEIYGTAQYVPMDERHPVNAQSAYAATKVAADQWHLNVLSKADRSKVADIPLTPGKLDASVEMFTIALTGEKDKGAFEMHWGTTALKASFTGK